MNKRILGLLLAGVIALSMASCSLFSSSTDTSETEESEELTESAAPTEELEGPESLPPKGAEKTLKLNSSVTGIRILGDRVLENRNYLNCDYSGSGMEFTVDMQGGDLSILTHTDGACNFLVQVDGKTYQPNETTRYLTVDGDGSLVIKGLSYGKHTVRIVKVTGYELAQAKFFSITLHGSLLTDKTPAPGLFYVEFLGGDAASGLGVLENGSNGYAGQDATKAYPYLLTQALGADYSVLALSDANLLSDMNAAYPYASVKKDATAEYGFTRSADATVIHVGSNGMDGEQFAAAYRQLLQTVKAKNGEDKGVLCVYHQEDTVAANAIAALCAELGGEAKGYFSAGVSQKDAGMLTVEEQAALAQALIASLQHAMLFEESEVQAPTQPDQPSQPDQPNPPSRPEEPEDPVGDTDLEIGSGEVDNKLDNNDPAWKG